MKVAVSGTPASGKSSIAKVLAERLGYRHFSVGDLQREIAREKGISILELGELEAKDPEIDNLMDDKQKKLGQTGDNFVIDSWLAARFIPDAFKVFVDADISVRARRRLSHRRSEENYADIDTVKREITERERQNTARWMRYYGFDYRKAGNYDMVLDSSNLTVGECVDRILERIKTIDLNKKHKSRGKTASLQS